MTETPDRKEKPESGAAWPWMIAAALAYWVGQLVSVPGVDSEALAEMLSRGGGGLDGLFGGALAAAFPILGSSLSTLVLVHVVLMVAGRAERPVARRIGAAVYLALSAIQAFSIAIWLESLSGADYFFFDVVPEPGWGFRLKLVLAMTAGAAVLWWLAGRVDASRRAHGALFLLLVSEVTALLPTTLSAGELVGLGTITPLGALAYLAVPIALCIAGGAVALRPARWPVRVVLGLELRSAWDALAFVLLGGLPGQALAAAFVMARPEAAAGWAIGLEQVAVVLVAITFAAWWWRRGRDEGTARPIWALLLPVALVAVGVGAIAMGLVSSGGLARLSEPGPLEGEATFEIVLEAESRFAPTDADAMVRRLEELGAEAEVTERSDRVIALRVTAVGVEPVLDALEPRAFSLHLTGPPLDPSLTPPAGIGRTTIPYADSHREVFEGACEAVRAYRDSLEPGGCFWVVDEIEPELPSEETSCQLGCFDPAPVLTSEHVERATVATDPQTYQPVVMVDLTEEGARRMGAATRANLRRPLAIVVDGDAMSIPIIQGEIGAHVQITLGGLLAADEAIAEAHSIALALRPGGHISTRWELAELRQ